MSLHSINARSLSSALPGPPWHGRGQGFESPKLHYLNMPLTRSFVLLTGEPD